MADGSPDDHHQGPAANGGDNFGNPDGIVTASSLSASVAEGLYSLISSVMNEFDSRAEATVCSQDQLAFAVDRLTGELDRLLEDAPSPFIMKHAARISSVRKRVRALSSVLKSIQRRIDNMESMLSTGLAHGAGEHRGQQQDP